MEFYYQKQTSVDRFMVNSADLSIKNKSKGNQNSLAIEKALYLIINCLIFITYESKIKELPFKKYAEIIVILVAIAFKYLNPKSSISRFLIISLLSLVDFILNEEFKFFIIILKSLFIYKIHMNYMVSLILILTSSFFLVEVFISLSVHEIYNLYFYLSLLLKNIILLISTVIQYKALIINSKIRDKLIEFIKSISLLSDMYYLVNFIRL